MRPLLAVSAEYIVSEIIRACQGWQEEAVRARERENMLHHIVRENDREGANDDLAPSTGPYLRPGSTFSQNPHRVANIIILLQLLYVFCKR